MRYVRSLELVVNKNTLSGFNSFFVIKNAHMVMQDDGFPSNNFVESMMLPGPCNHLWLYGADKHFQKDVDFEFNRRVPPQSNSSSRANNGSS